MSQQQILQLAIRQTFSLLTLLSYIIACYVHAHDKQEANNSNNSATDSQQSTLIGHNFKNIVGDISITAIGISETKYENDLRSQEKRLVKKYETTIQQLNETYEKNRLRELRQLKKIQAQELLDVRIKLANTKASYKEYIDFLLSEMKSLSEYRDILSNSLIENAQYALVNGDKSKAKALYSKVTAQSHRLDDVIANASYSLGKLAEEEVDYKQAYMHYQAAASRKALPEYLRSAGKLAEIHDQFDKANEYYSKSLEIQIQQYGETHPKVASDLQNLAVIYYRQGNIHQAFNTQKKAFDIYEYTLGKTDINTAKAGTNLGIYHLEYGDSDSAIGILKYALNVFNSNYQNEHLLKSKSMNNIGITYEKKGDLDIALQFFLQAENEYHQSNIVSPIDLASILNNMGGVWGKKGEWGNAIALYKKAADLLIPIIDQNSYRLAKIWTNLGSAWVARKNISNAAYYFDKTLKIYQQNKEIQDYAIPPFVVNFASLLAERGKFEKALGYYYQVLDLYSTTFGPSYSKIADLWVNIGSMWAKKVEYPEAIASYHKALAIYQKSQVRDQRSISTTYSNLATVYKMNGQNNKAIQYTRELAALNIELFGDDHISLASVYNTLGNLFYDINDNKRAVEYYEKSLLIYEKNDAHKENFITQLTRLSELWAAIGNYCQANEYYERALNTSKLVSKSEKMRFLSIQKYLSSRLSHLKDSEKLFEDCSNEKLLSVIKMGG